MTDEPTQEAEPTVTMPLRRYETIERLLASAKAVLELRESARQGYIAMGFGGENTYATEAKFDSLESAIHSAELVTT